MALSVYGNIPVGYARLVAGIGRGLKAARGRASFTQVKLAELMSVEQAAVSKWETDRAMPETATLLRLATVLRCSVEDLLIGVDEAYDQNRNLAAEKRDRTEPSTRADPTHGKVPDALTSSGTPSAVQDRLLASTPSAAATEEPSNADTSSAGQFPDRLPQSESLLDAQVQRLLALKALWKHVDRLDDAATAIRAVADDLRSRLTPNATRTAGSPRDRRRADVRRAPTRRSAGGKR